MEVEEEEEMEEEVGEEVEEVEELVKKMGVTLSQGLGVSLVRAFQN